MNKYLISLGLMLIASLSFADEDSGPANWMQSLQGRYACMYDYNYNMLELIGPECEIIDDGQYFDILDTYFTCEDCMYADTYDMYVAGDCSPEDGEVGVLLAEPNPTAMFRSAMNAFNSDSAAFKRIFLADVRGCLADPEGCDCDRGEIQGLLSTIRSSYMECVSERPYFQPPKHRPPSEDVE